ncbi:hypothetical protein BCR32DRAFT_267859 [Anaeromyces robustus]|uniref:Sjogrens syndrome scleroderma autoantigen 1 n=1 Tax=Anaeromyces robustus TaxID=1754192 RepID=A0A1Y1X9K3_9FUNG|nr:hypothetical protein BCR32DRAFT_267859 [Anaeromyces robustus]|eukprot:ORX82096.1 hypothetical protein BCR32DRAFT_267859 [Anaeromyces robustus]
MESFEQRHEKGIANMGELLLKGYIMSAEACANCNCVLFKKTRNSPLFCPICDEGETKKENKNNNEKIIKQKNENLEKESKTNNNDENSNQINIFKNVNNNDEKNNQINISKNDVNSKMSKLLLAGWTLTNDNCPFCVGIPLMRNKEKEQFCVKCEKSFINEEEAKKQGMTINSGKIDNIESNKDKQKQLENKTIKHTLENENFVPDKEYVKKEKILVNDSLSEEVKIECSKTSTALLHQLTFLRNKLEVINDNNDYMIPNIQYTMNICDAITSVIKALNACNTINNN